MTSIEKLKQDCPVCGNAKNEMDNYCYTCQLHKSKADEANKEIKRIKAFGPKWRLP